MSTPQGVDVPANFVHNAQPYRGEPGVLQTSQVYCCIAELRSSAGVRPNLFEIGRFRCERLEAVIVATPAHWKALLVASLCGKRKNADLYIMLWTRRLTCCDNGFDRCRGGKLPLCTVAYRHALFVMLFRGDIGAIMHIDTNPPLYVTEHIDSFVKLREVAMGARHNALQAFRDR
jgi:hypothetical protein